MTTLDEPAARTAGPAQRAHEPNVADAAIGWADELAALGGRDPLLTFRDLKVGTLDLAAAEPEARKRLLDGAAMTVTRLFPHEPLRSSALRSAHAIRDKARELVEEYGIAGCMLAVGIATWSDPFAAHRPTAPVLLRPATITARDPAETDFVIELTGEPEVNPVLLHALDAQVGLRFEPDALRDPAGALRYPFVVERLREFAPAHVIDGFSIAHRALLATFAREPLSLGLDLAALRPELARHPIVAALAGVPVELPPTPALSAAQYPVFEADSAQHAAIAAAARAHVRIDAPPGTGRTQTVANLVAELIGQGKSVLLVGHARPSVRDVIGRLRAVGLEDVVLDLSDGRTAARDSVTRVAEVARRLSAEPADPPGPVPVADDASPRAYRDALHRRREPWGTSVYDAIVALVDAPLPARTDATIPVDSLRAIDRAAAQTIRDRLRAYTDLGGLTLTEQDSPWFGSTVAKPADADRLATIVTGLAEHDLPALRDAATRAAVEVGLAGPQTAAECLATVDLLRDVAATMRRFVPRIWSAPLDDMLAAVADRQWRTEHGSTVGALARRALRVQVRELLRNPRERAGLREALLAAHEQRAAWRQRSRDGKLPRVGAHLQQAGATATTVRDRLRQLADANTRTADLADLPFAEAGARLAALAADRDRLAAIPRLRWLKKRLSAAGLDDLLRALRERAVNPLMVGRAFDYAAQRSLLAAWRAGDPMLAGFDAAEHERAIERFRRADSARLDGAGARTRAVRAERYAAAAAEHEGQAAVATSARRVPRTVADLLRAAPDIALAAVPCWVMSPLAVAGALPPRRLFDVVILLDAGRMPVAHAIPAITRAARVVVVGDGTEVPVAPFSTVVEPDVETDDAAPALGGTLPDSVFCRLAGCIPTAALTTNYSSRDDRLAAFAAGPFADRLTVVPSARGPSPLRHERVDVTGDVEQPTDSTAAEVARVVDLVLEHARTRPYQSLGVVTLGSRHARRIDDALRRALIRSPDAAQFIREDRAEPFFVKPLDRADAETRDAVIVSVGYGRSVDGRVLYRFGVLDRPGGDLRLTALVGRTRERCTVVSAFGLDDLSPRRLTTAGAQALYDLLQHVLASSSEVRSTEPRSDALEAMIARRLQAAGVDIAVGVGDSACRLPVVARHPARRDRFVLAVETDGPQYAALPTVRERDRLRPQHLARLGWSMHRVWSVAWLDAPAQETERLLAAYAAAVAAADAYDWADAAARADVVVGMPDDAGEAPADAGSAGARSDTEPAADAPTAADSAPVERGDRPDVPPRQPISSYTGRELAALARWIESDGRQRTEADTVELLAEELQLADRESRAEDVLRHAVRLARAGAPAM
ncbi:MAG: DUF4011 domain-containing protein [Jiangellaceae bacterium]|nr:DUF4011 domain-containing protein [Jiangellaceae bacterium]